MRAMLLLALAACLSAADAPPASPKVDVVKEPPRELTADDLQNLVICARRSLPALAPDEISAVATSIKHAEADLAAMRAAALEPPKAEAPAKKP